MNSRREMLKLLGMAPVAVPITASAELTSLIAAPSTQAALAAFGGAQNTMPTSAGEGIFGKLLGRKLSFLRDLADHQAHNERAARIEGLDHDIAAIRSTSRGYRVSKQLQRDSANAEMFQRASRTLWGEAID